jgi:ADP-heptose:LPS heptosyltransferase
LFKDSGTVNRQSKRILIYRLGSLGDTIMALPCFHKIREVYPQADITLLTNRPVMGRAAPVEAVLGNDYFFNRVIDYPIASRSPKVLFRLIKLIRHNKIDTVINLTAPRSKTAAIRDRWFFRFAGVWRLIGFSKKNHALQHTDPATGFAQWEAERLVQQLSELGPVNLADEQSWDLRLTDEELSLAEEKLAGLKTANIIAINTGTKVQANDWSAANWIKLLKRLVVSLENWQLVVIGATDDAQFADECLEAWGNNGINLCGQITPRVSAAVLKKAKIFVGHDSGPMHLAACMGTPCVGIFSARNMPGKWFPRGLNNRIIYHQTDCAGCRLENCIEQKKKCILSITTEEVEQAVKEILITD